jgi:hypothetical protein
MAKDSVLRVETLRSMLSGGHKTRAAVFPLPSLPERNWLLSRKGRCSRRPRNLCRDRPTHSPMCSTGIIAQGSVPSRANRTNFLHCLRARPARWGRPLSFPNLRLHLNFRFGGAFFPWGLICAAPSGILARRGYGLTRQAGEVWEPTGPPATWGERCDCRHECATASGRWWS